MSHEITLQSRLPSALRAQVEALLFFNSAQHRMRDAIEASIERYGLPEIIDENGWLHLRVAGLEQVQTLFAVRKNIAGERAVGAVAYIRESVERITVVHVSVADEYSAQGRYAHERVLPQLLYKIRDVAKRTTGIRHVDLAYRRNRSPATEQALAI
jgi:hypothetical protein